jgi:hypothetical protein
MDRNDDVELVRLGGSGARLVAGSVVVCLLLAVAIAKPWQPARSAASGAPESAEPVPQAALIPTPPATAPARLADELCQSADGWSVVSDDVELGRPVRTWRLADVEYSPVPPPPESIPVTTLISASILRLGLCVPADVLAVERTWTLTVWRQEVAGARADQWTQIASLRPAAGSHGDFLEGPPGGASGWAPGLYFVGTSFPSSGHEAWLAVDIKAR